MQIKDLQPLTSSSSEQILMVTLPLNQSYVIIEIYTAQSG